MREDDDRDMFKNRDTLSYGTRFLTTDFTDFTCRGFREPRCPNFNSAYLCVPP
jgi:hypothetical protein